MFKRFYNFYLYLVIALIIILAMATEANFLYPHGHLEDIGMLCVYILEIMLGEFGAYRFHK